MEISIKHIPCVVLRLWKQADNMLSDKAWVLTLLLCSVKPPCCSIRRIARHHVVGQVSNTPPGPHIRLNLESFLYGSEHVGQCDTKLVPNCVGVALT